MVEQCNQFEFECHIIAALRIRWNLSTIPLARGLYALVRIRILPKSFESSLKKEVSYYHPWSVTIVDGSPNLATQPELKAKTTVSADKSANRLSANERTCRYK